MFLAYISLTKFILLIGAQWTGIVTTIAIEMLKSGMVEAVICVQRYWKNYVQCLLVNKMLISFIIKADFVFSVSNIDVTLHIIVIQMTDSLQDLF